MIKLDISLTTAGLANGIYRVRAKGCIAVVLYWANSQGELPDWTPFAYVPITSNERGSFGSPDKELSQTSICLLMAFRKSATMIS